jgi:hypothetical protein
MSSHSPSLEVVSLCVSTMMNYATSCLRRPKGFPSIAVFSSWHLTSIRNTIMQGLGFTRSGFFVNTACIDPTLLLVDNSRMMRLADTRQLAIGIMLGVITECNIINEFTGGSSSSPYTLRKVTIAPFAQEMRRDTSVWGKVLGFQSIVGQVSALGISFSTRRKSEQQGTSLSPMKSAGYLLSVTSNLSSPSSSRHIGSYPSSRGFDDHSMCCVYLVFDVSHHPNSTHLRGTSQVWSWFHFLAGGLWFVVQPSTLSEGNPRPQRASSGGSGIYTRDLDRPQRREEFVHKPAVLNRAGHGSCAPS